MVIFKLFIQVYIVSGGWTGSSTLASTETLEKDGGSAWQLVASLPSKRFGLKGVGLDKGRFLVTGQLTTCTYCGIYRNRIMLGRWREKGE